MPVDSVEDIGGTMQRFLEWARQMGWLYQEMPIYLERFRQYLQSRGIERLEQVDTVLLLDYQRHLRTTRSAATVNYYMKGVRALWRYLIREERVARDVTKGVPYLRQDHTQPYLYDEQELQRIDQALLESFEAANTPRRRYRWWRQRATFGLLRDCGLRRSEACRLDVDHYNDRERTLRIERTKFFKTRVIPIPRSTCRLLEQHLVLRNQVLRDPRDRQAMFLSGRGWRVCKGTLDQEWRELLRRLGLYKPRRVHGHTAFGGTNLHALRHRFAVSCLERWQRQGRDVEHLLPLLSGYLGHAKVTYTAVYLHLTPLLRRQASQRFGDLVLPALDHGTAGAALMEEDEIPPQEE